MIRLSPPPRNSDEWGVERVEDNAIERAINSAMR